MISFRPTFIAVAVVVLVGGCSIVEVKAGNIRGQQTQTKYNRVLQKEDTGILDGGGEEEGDAGVVSSMTPYEVFLTQECAAQVFDLGVCLDGGDDDVDSDSESTSLSSRIVVKEDNEVDTNANCYQCIYLLTTIQLSKIDRCVEYCDYVGDTCNQEATALVNCGNEQENTDQTMSDTDPAPVPDSTDPVPVPVPAATDAATDAAVDAAADAAAVADDLSSFVEIPTTAITVGTDSAFPDTDTTTTTADVSNIRKDIPGTALDAGIFSTLVTALNATDLVDALSTPNGPYTVFAPTDDAFAALPEGLVGCLFEEENVSVLSNILLYHVVSGQALLSTDLSDSMILPTVFEGHNVGIGVNSADDGTGMLNTGIDVTITINDAATISTANILASNGVIHSLDMVLLPSSIDVIAILNACTTDNNNGGGGDIIGDVAVPESTLEPEPVSSSAATTTTIGDCPETFPNSGDPCTVPTGLPYQTCDSIEGDVLTRCTCRNDGAKVFMCTVGSIPPPTAAPIVSPPTSAPVVVPPPITPALVTTAAPVVAPPVSEQTSSSLSLNNNLVPSCYVASLAADGTTYTSNEDKVLPNTGENCYVAEGLEYGNCVFARDDNPSYYYVIYRCLCNPRELPDDTYLDKFICNIILEEPYRI
mmetsp:Transcript_16467/g.18998  ORF Transcript_16467/g.18998 Transcript_16467/m.18998 type:complete len:647 (+) Transcript_16467:88-2028(+)